MIGHLLNTTLTVYRGAYAADGAGGRTETFASQGTVRAMVSQPTEQELMTAAQLGSRLDHVVHVDYDADVERGDQLDNGGARRLRVLSVIGNSRDTYKRLHCEVVQGE